MDDTPITAEHTTNEIGQPVGVPVDAELPIRVPSTDEMVGRYCTVSALSAKAHAAALFSAYDEASDDRAWTYLFHDRSPTVEHLERWLAAREGVDDPSHFVIADAHGPCGIAVLQRIAPAHGVVEVGNIHLAPRLQATRASTEAMFLLMQRVFETGYRRYEWKCDSLNAPSRTAATRLGFTYEGEFRQAIVYKGRNRDTAWFSIIDEEWPRLRNEFERWLDPTNFDDTGRQRTALRHHV